MSNNRKNSRQRGAALVIGLILLAIITLLAVVGMNISNSELASATSEQVRLRAFQAAETGIEYAMKDDVTENDIFHTPAKCGSSKLSPVTVIDGSPINTATGLPTDTFANRISYVDENQVTEGYSNGFSSFHYNIESHGNSSRNAIASNKQGTYLVNNTGAQGSWKPMGTACYVPITGTF